MGTGTAAYGVLAGLSAGIGLFFMALGLRRGLAWSTELFVGLLALAAAGQTVATLGLHSSSSIDGYAAILHGPFTYFGIATLALTTWTVGSRTRLWYPQIPVALTILALFAVVLDVLGPGNFIADDVTELREVRLLGEDFVAHRPGPSGLEPVLLVYLAAITGYVGFGLMIRVRQRTHKVDLLMVGIAIAWAFTLYDLLVDEAVVNTSYLSPFGLVALVGVLAIENASMTATNERQLQRQSEALEDVVAARTEALRAAHEDLIRQLDGQNRSSLRLARLSELFLLLNNVTVDDDVEEVLTEALGRLGELVEATLIHLVWHHSANNGEVLRVDWNQPGTSTTVDEERAVIDQSLRSGELIVGRLVITAGEGGFSSEHRRLIDLTVQYLGGFLARLRLESGRVNSAVERERQRIARELHDSLSQRLYAAAFNAEAVSLSAATDPDSAAQGASKIRVLVLSTLAEIRTLLFGLQPETLSNQSLIELVAQLCTSVAEIYQRPVDLVVTHDESHVPTEPKLALYRIVQEAVGNALRHSDASRIAVTADVGIDRVSIEVADDGAGFDPDLPATGHGLRNMRERAAEVGATLDLTSGPGIGTTAHVIWPRHQNPAIDLTDQPSLERAD